MDVKPRVACAVKTSAEEGAGKTGDAGNAKALELVLRALARYPQPVPIPGPPVEPPALPRVTYASPLDLAITIYAERFQRTEEGEVITEAFASVAPKVLSRCESHIAAAMNAIVDGTCAPEATHEYLSLMHELSTLATMFVGPPGGAFSGPYAPQYTAVCEMIKGMMAASPK